MNKEPKYTKNQIDKIGNTLIFLSTYIPNLPKTKALKLLYLLDEFSISETGIPFLNLDYFVWKRGPVARDLFHEFNSISFLSEYVYIEKLEKQTLIKAKKEFSDDEFSQRDLNLLSSFVEQCNQNNINSYHLVEQTHEKDSLWYKTAQKFNLISFFNQNITNTSNIKIDFLELVENDNYKKNRYLEFQENVKFSNYLHNV